MIKQENNLWIYCKNPKSNAIPYFISKTVKFQVCVWGVIIEVFFKSLILTKKQTTRTYIQDNGMISLSGRKKGEVGIFEILRYAYIKR